MREHGPVQAEVFLCRHGRTQLNAAGLLRGRLDPDLDATGRAEARSLAQHLAPARITRVVTSPLLRALHTAEAIAALTGAPVETDIRLIDRDFGDFAGRTAHDVLSRYGSYDSAPGVEKLASLRDRANAVFAELAIEPGPIAVITHDAVMRLLAEELRWSQAPAEFRPSAGGCVQLRHDGAAWRMIDAWGVGTGC